MQSINRFLYGPPIEERVKKWQQGLRTEQRRLDREIRQLEGAQTKTRNEIKQLAKKGDTKNAKILAREVVRSNKQKNRMHTSKARLNSVGMQLQHQMATLKITSNLQTTTQVIKMSNQLFKLPELQKTMMEMSAEMTKAGIMSEMVDDTMDTLDEGEDELEEEAEGEVEKVLFEITAGKLGQAGKAGTELPSLKEPEVEEVDPDIERMQRELDAVLRS